MSVATRPDATAERLALHLERMAALGALRRRLCGSATVGALFAAAAELACAELGFERGLVLSVDGGRLTGEVTDALRNEASDRLRRHVLRAPPTLARDAHEAELIRLSKPVWPPRPGAPSVLARDLDLREFVLAPVAAENRVLALMLVDRGGPEVEALDAVEVAAFADVLAGALAYVVLRARQHELAGDLRHFMASTQALMREILETPVTLPTAAGARPAFPLVGVIAKDSEGRLAELLSEGEMRIASLLVQGRSNREIADELIVSPETVKAHVARILRKLGVANRVEAVAMILRLGPPPA